MKLTQHFKRILSALLVLITVFSMVPAKASAAGTTDVAVFFTDLHSSASNAKLSLVQSTMAALSSMPVSSVTSIGDLFSSNESLNRGNTADVTNAIYAGLNDTSVAVNYTWSDHDREAGITNFTGLIYGHNGTMDTTADDANYYIYAISMSDMTTNPRYGTSETFTTSKLTDFTNTVAQLDQSKPLFIASHMPLIDRRDDNGHAYDWYTVISAAATKQDIIFLSGHNHKYDTANDYYYAKGSTMSVCKDKYGNAQNVTLNFTHIIAGYLDPSSTGSTSNTTRQGTVLVAQITDSNIQMTTYNTNGVYTGSYYVNQSVPRTVHVHSYSSVVTDPTCTSDGFTTYTCSCGHSYTGNTVIAYGHDYSTVTIEPTPDAEGSIISTCNVCGHQTVDILKYEHVHTYETVTVEATCTTIGYTAYTCSGCGAHYNGDRVEALGHSYISIITPPTCTTAGFTTSTCSACGHSTVTDNTAALGHKYTGVESDGCIIYTCGNCGTSYSEEIEDNHTYSKVNKFSTGKNHLIVLYANKKYYALSHSGNKISAVQITVAGNNVTSRVTQDMLWTSSSSKLYYKDGNTSYYLNSIASNKLNGDPTLDISATAAAKITYSSSKLKVGTKYMRFSNNVPSLSGTATTVYLYKQS